MPPFGDENCTSICESLGVATPEASPLAPNNPATGLLPNTDGSSITITWPLAMAIGFAANILICAQPPAGAASVEI